MFCFFLKSRSDFKKTTTIVLGGRRQAERLFETHCETFYETFRKRQVGILSVVEIDNRSVE
jgi:hypothetical protein